MSKQGKSCGCEITHNGGIYEIHKIPRRDKMNKITEIDLIRANLISHVKAYMAKHNIQFAEIARRLEIGKSTAWRLFFDKVTNPQLKTLIKVANTLELSLTDLLDHSADH